MDKRDEYRLDGRDIIWVLGQADALGEPKFIVCDCLDISANGLMIEIDSHLLVNSVQQICIQRPNSAKRYFLTVEVKWSRDLGEGRYNCGLSIFESEGTDVQKWKSLMADRLEFDVD